MKIKILLLISLLSTLYFVVTPSRAAASLFEDFLNEMNNTLRDGVDNAKNLISPTENKSIKDKVLAVEADIILAPEGDVNKNGQIDAGDTITYTYTIQNNTDKKYVYATLKTNTQRESLNFVRNVKGVTGIRDDGKTIEFPNLRIDPGIVKQISFDANVNYFTEQDPIISTEPELMTEDNKSLLKSVRKQIQSKRIKKEDIPQKIQMFRQDK